MYDSLNENRDVSVTKVFALLAKILGLRDSFETTFFNLIPFWECVIAVKKILLFKNKWIKLVHFYPPNNNFQV